MDPQQLAHFETLCQQLQIGGDERAAAENQLNVFNVQAERIPQLQFVLEKSGQAVAQHFAASALVKLVTTYWNNYTAPQRLEIRNYALNFLAQTGNFSSSVTSSVIYFRIM